MQMMATHALFFMTLLNCNMDCFVLEAYLSSGTAWRDSEHPKIGSQFALEWHPSQKSSEAICEKKAGPSSAVHSFRAGPFS